MSIGFNECSLIYLYIAYSLLFNSAICATVVVSADDCSIQEAIDMAMIGDTIEVHSGRYQEHINISKPVILQGLDDGGGMPVIASNEAQSIIEINTERATLDGFYVEPLDNSNECGVVVTSDNTTIKNNVIVNNGFSGIQILKSNNSYIVNNSISNNDYGIILSNADNDIIEGNSISSNYVAGIKLDRSSTTNIMRNVISKNGIGIVYDDYSITSGMNVDNTNTFYENGGDSQYVSEIAMNWVRTIL